jgi:hypothetical protein
MGYSGDLFDHPAIILETRRGRGEGLNGGFPCVEFAADRVVVRSTIEVVQDLALELLTRFCPLCDRYESLESW